MIAYGCVCHGSVHHVRRLEARLVEAVAHVGFIRESAVPPADKCMAVCVMYRAHASPIRVWYYGEAQKVEEQNG